MPKFVFLWTDFTVWVLVAGLAWYFWRARGSDARAARLRATWRHVGRHAPAMCAAVVLAFMLAVALLDSIHFWPRLPAAPGAAPDAEVAYAPRTLSVFDAL